MRELARGDSRRFPGSPLAFVACLLIGTVAVMLDRSSILVIVDSTAVEAARLLRAGGRRWKRLISF
jgi:hypothetical protein